MPEADPCRANSQTGVTAAGRALWPLHGLARSHAAVPGPAGHGRQAGADARRSGRTDRPRGRATPGKRPGRPR